MPRRPDGVADRKMHVNNRGRGSARLTSRPLCLHCAGPTDALFARKRALSPKGKAQFSFESVQTWRFCMECGPVLVAETMGFQELADLLRKAKRKRAITVRPVKWRQSVDHAVDASILQDALEGEAT